MTWGLDEVTVRFDGTEALDEVSLDVDPGAITAVIGGDGAGKSTALRALAGLVPVAEGRVRRPPEGRLGYLPETSGVYPDLSVAENLSFAATSHGARGAEPTGRADELLERTGLTEARDRLAGHLSGGMRQKLGLAVALIHRPDLLVLDEPTTGIDPVSRAELWRLIADETAGNAGVAVSTSYLDEAERAGEVVALDEGRPSSAGSSERVVASLRDRAAAVPGGTGGRGSGVGTEVLAEVRDVVKRFDSFTAVDHVSLEIRRGEVVGLVGANGAGKTTAIRMLLGLLPQTEGTVALFGRPPSRASRQWLGYMPQSLGLYDDLTVRENLAFASAAFGAAPPALPDDLAGLGNRVLRTLSLGIQRRVAFVSALAHRPRLLVLDEPTSGVDPVGRAGLWRTIREAVAGGVGALVTTHFMEEAEHCDRVVVMAAGRVAAAGTMDEIVGRGRSVEVRSESWSTAYRALTEAGVPAALVGMRLRVPGAEPERIDRILREAGVAAVVRTVLMTFEERFVALTVGTR
jgi:ABC-type multidrug transport system ATPase subunit